MSRMNDSAPADVIVNIPTSTIRVAGKRPGLKLDPDDEMDRRFVKSIQEHGILQPIVVRPVEGGHELVFGTRRLDAARRLGMKTIPARICEATDEQVVLVVKAERSLRGRL